MNSSRSVEPMLLGLAGAMMASLLVAVAVAVHPFTETSAGISGAARLWSLLLMAEGNAAVFTTTSRFGG